MTGFGIRAKYIERKFELARNSQIIILGSSGMLGQQVSRVFRQKGLIARELSQKGLGASQFTFSGETAPELALKLGLKGEEWIINCVGWIPQKSSGKDSVDSKVANLLNTQLPHKLDQLGESHGVKVLQVTSDCVFSGREGPYSENSVFDPIDLYGATKVLGERLQSRSMKIRASIIGPDTNSSAGLFSWALGQQGEDFIPGFNNHFWNGVTTLAMARLFSGIIMERKFVTGNFHWTPSNWVTKAKLLAEIGYSLPDLVPGVAPIAAEQSVDRRLVTLYPEQNLNFWKIAGYQLEPRIEDLVVELAEDYQVNWIFRRGRRS
jgi:dTDP-4-dehydrorhamnose reductase